MAELHAGTLKPQDTTHDFCTVPALGIIFQGYEQAKTIQHCGTQCPFLRIHRPYRRIADILPIADAIALQLKKAIRRTVQDRSQEIRPQKIDLVHI